MLHLSGGSGAGRTGWLIVLLAVVALAMPAAAEEVIRSEKYELRLETLAQGLEHPWSLAFLPDGGLLITERPGRLRLWRHGVLQPEPISGVPTVAAYGQGGLFDVVLHPRFADNRRLYLAYAAERNGTMNTELAMAEFDGSRLLNLRVLFRAEPKVSGGHHFGGRIVFDREGYIYLTLGERGRDELAQDPSNHAGSVVRLRDDGSVPPDNPWFGRAGARPELFTIGHRNPQGMALHPDTGAVWIHEHGPRGGDEINILKAGRNYGWPVLTFGRAYSGLPMGEGTHREGMEPPIHHWTPSIAPSGMAFYTADAFPGWRDNLLVGALVLEHLARLELDGKRVVRQERLLEGKVGRIRDVRQGPDGFIYLLTDHRNGALYRLRPAF